MYPLRMIFSQLSIDSEKIPSFHFMRPLVFVAILMGLDEDARRVLLSIAAPKQCPSIDGDAACERRSYAGGDGRCRQRQPPEPRCSGQHGRRRVSESEGARTSPVCLKSQLHSTRPRRLSPQVPLTHFTCHIPCQFPLEFQMLYPVNPAVYKHIYIYIHVCFLVYPLTKGPYRTSNPKTIPGPREPIIS